ncbi:O-antigen polymerase [Lactobacillus intestinalis]|uniref:O-antigen polymerase n=1 Tax=Lactobacillus intestinalis TaxID=151781 RepID=UPI002616364D|nr:O-antigen polymerase [Lactobacillus intestinalis]
MIFLCFTLLVLLIFAYFLNEREVVAPGVIFTASFFIASIFALLNVKKWSLILDYHTFLVIILGVLEFVAISSIISLLKLKDSKILSCSNTNNKEILYTKKKSWFLYIIIIVELFNIWMMIKYIKEASGISNLSMAMNYLREQSFLENSAVKKMPWLTAFGSTFNMSVGLFFEYILAKSFFNKRLFSWPIAIIAILGILTPFLNSSRGVSIFLIIALLIDIYFASREHNIDNSHRNGKYIIIVLIIGIVVLSLLQWSASLLGRNVDNFTPFDYISNYIGAQIKNLDIFIRTTSFPVKEDIFGKQTFYSILPTLSKILGLNINTYQLDLPFQVVNGNSLGNVYTTFYPWLYDFGYTGVIVLTAVMAIISQLIFNVAKVEKNADISVAQIIYSYVGSFIALSFFSNKFFENMNTSFIYTILICYLLKLFFIKKYKFLNRFF